MPRKKKKKVTADKAVDEALASRPVESSEAAVTVETDVSPSGTGDEEGEVPGSQVEEDAEVSLAEIAAELDEARERHLRLAAEYDNYRKRTARELSEAGQRAQALLIGRLLDALDDLGRVSQLDPNGTGSKEVIEGVVMVERKVVRELENLGLDRVGVVGEPFDPNDHEAIGAVPADSADKDHTVANVVQPGYRMGATLIRPARVQVFTWQDAAAEDSDS